MTVFTIGHFDYDLVKFHEMMEKGKVTKIIDVRAFPMSKKSPHYNQDVFKKWLEENNYKYKHITLLGGRRGTSSFVGDDLNAGWKNQSFRNYSDYTLTDDFKEGIQVLKKEMEDDTVALLCDTSPDTGWMLSQSALSPASLFPLPRPVSKNWLSNHMGMSQGPTRLGRAWVWVGAGKTCTTLDC